MQEKGERRRVALVTGGCGGIGAAICRRLARDGLAVAVLDRPQSDAGALAAALPGEGHRGFQTDVADEASVSDIYRQIEAEMGLVDVLVTAAGILLLRPDGARNPVAETPFEEWQRTLDINTNGTFLFCREYARRVNARREGGRIVTLGSVAAQLGGYRSSSAYIASKAAVMGFTKGLARELAPFGITANSVAPGLIDAPMLRLSLAPAGDGKAAASIPLGRIGTPEDVAGAVAYLVSQDASYVTGNVIDVNGGYRMQ